MTDCARTIQDHQEAESMAAPETPLDELQWRAPEWIAQWGLRTDNGMVYKNRIYL